MHLPISISLFTRPYTSLLRHTVSPTLTFYLPTSFFLFTYPSFHHSTSGRAKHSTIYQTLFTSFLLRCKTQPFSSLVQYSRSIYLFIPNLKFIPSLLQSNIHGQSASSYLSLSLSFSANPFSPNPSLLSVSH